MACTFSSGVWCFGGHGPASLVPNSRNEIMIESSRYTSGEYRGESGDLSVTCRIAALSILDTDTLITSKLYRALTIRAQVS